MTSFIDPLVVGRVIGEVVDLFVPTVVMAVSYGPKHVNNGCDVKPSAVTVQPVIQISSRHDELYTLIMTDPDAPSPNEPTMREVIHWVVVDIPGGTDPSKGQELLSYLAPRPIVGIHRYVFVLFQYKAPFSGDGNMDHPCPLQHPLLSQPLQSRPPRRDSLLQLPEGASTEEEALKKDLHGKKPK